MRTSDRTSGDVRRLPAEPRASLVDLSTARGIEEAAASLDAHRDYRVLRRLEPRRAAHRFGIGAARWHGLALDVETEGLEPGRHRIIELAMQRFLADEDGSIVDVGRPRRWYEDPGRPLSPEIVRLTGITDADVAGRSICDAEAVSVMMDVDFVVAHNARFDLPFCERRLPDAVGRPWICTLAEVDWRSEGYEGRSLSHLLMQAGVFYRAHSAQVDVAALIRLLEHVLPSGRTVLATAMANASTKSWLVEALDAPYEARLRLKERGYRWHAARRLWWREIRFEARADEAAWASTEVYRGRGSLAFRSLDWTSRHAEH